MARAYIEFIDDPNGEGVQINMFDVGYDTEDQSISDSQMPPETVAAMTRAQKTAHVVKRLIAAKWDDIGNQVRRLELYADGKDPDSIPCECERCVAKRAKKAQGATDWELVEDDEIPTNIQVLFDLLRGRQ
jgi:hypothetical protein